MSFSADQFEADLELLYWKFDALVKGHNTARKAAGLGPMSERDAFKTVLRNWEVLTLLGRLARTVSQQGGVTPEVHSILGTLRELHKKALNDRG